MTSQPCARAIAPELQQHPGYARVFKQGHLTFGFIAPLESYPNSPGPTLQDHAQMAQRVDEAGFSAIWLRDVLFYDPNFGDVGQILDPLIVAKQAASVDQLLGGRFILGLATGDRPIEYPAFGLDFANRAERFRDALGIIRATTQSHWAKHTSRFYGQLNGEIDLVPKPVGTRLPTLIVGHAGQSQEWIGEHSDGTLSYTSNPALIPQVIERWRAVCGNDVHKPYGYGTLFDLDRDPDHPVQAGRVLRAGRNALIEHWKRQQDQGVGHVALHFKPQRRPAAEVIDELAEYLLPHFPSITLPVAPQPLQAAQ
jgi:hypothetical protein